MNQLFLLCNAHLDPVWLWQWREGAAEAVSTFRTAADFCEEYDGFVFNHNEALLYEWVEEYEPALFARIQRLAAEGKWHIMGGWYLQPDCTLPCGESFIRQIETGRRYFQEKFGKSPTTAVNFDPFGHTRGLVQILKKCGYDSYIFMRPGAQTYGNYLWEGFDGSAVIAHRLYGGYNSLKGHAVEKLESILKEHGDRGANLMPWGIGDHGGGASRPDLDAIEAVKSQYPDVEIMHSTPEAYFAAADTSELEVVSQSLVHCMVGCYTSMARIKQSHRRLENQLALCELMSSHAAIACGLAYDQEGLVSAEKDLLFSEFHDILPGSMIKSSEDQELARMSHALTILDRISTRAFFSLAGGQPRGKDGEIPVLVYNPHPYSIAADVEVEFQLEDQNWTDGEYTVAHVYRTLSDGSREWRPTQNEREECTFSLDWRKKAVFRAELAPCSMNRFDCTLEVVSPYTSVAAYTEEMGRILVRTEDMAVAVDTSTGLLERCQIKGQEYLRPGSGFLAAYRDNEDPWGMQVDRFQDLLDTFQLLTDRQASVFRGYADDIRPNVCVIENGDVRLKLQAIFGCGASIAVVEYTIPKFDTYLDLQIRLFSNDANRMVKYCLKPAISTREFKGQTAFGAESLASDGREVGFQKWCALTEAGHTLAVFNTGSYAGSCTDGQLQLSLLRTPVYSAHPIKDRQIAPHDYFRPHIDMGERVFTFRIQGGSDMADLDKKAALFSTPPVALSFFPSGDGMPSTPLVELDSDLITLSVFKKAGDGWTLRLFNSADHPVDCLVRVPCLHAQKTVSFGKFEVKTFRLTESLFEETSMIEY